MASVRSLRRDLFALFGLLLLPLVWFLPVLFPSISGLTLLPYDNLYSFEPWRSLQPGLVPHNRLLSDLVLENAVWKLHIRQTFADASMGVSGRFPLWNPEIVTGLPFFAAGQASTLYPLSFLFYFFPLEAAYGWFTAIQLGLAGINMYIFGRVLELRPPAAFFSGVVFMFSGFLMVSVVFTMFVAAVVWLPLLLALLEIIIRKQEEKGNQSFRPVPYIGSGAVVIGLVILAGHPEMIYYTLMVAGLYGGVRLIAAWRSAVRFRSPNRTPRNHAGREPRWGWRVLLLAGWLLAMAVLGVGLGAIQLIPLIELLPHNFREGSASFQQVLDWAWPERQVLTFFLPDVFGNPSHHWWYNLWERRWVPITENALGEPIDNPFWGVKNYVEGGNYLGLATWLLAAVALFGALKTRAGLQPEITGERGAQAGPRPHLNEPRDKQQGFPAGNREQRLPVFFFFGLATLSLLFAFGTPLYGLLYYGVPGWSQLHSPFRWVFPFTLCMATLSGIGLNDLLTSKPAQRRVGFRRFSSPPTRPVAGLALGSAIVGALALLTVVWSLFAPDSFIRLGQRAVDNIDLVQMAFTNGEMFWSYEAANLVRFGIFALLSGILIWYLTLAHSKRQTREEPIRSPAADASYPRGVRLCALLLICVVVADLYVAHGRFNPASPAALSPLNPASQPPVVRFLQNRATEVSGAGINLWRFTTFDMPGEKTFNANVGMYYGWHDIRGYDSVLLRQYTQFMGKIAPQGELLYNRIAALYSDVAGYDILDNPLLDLLNVRYVLTQHHLPNPDLNEIYRDESIAVYENQTVMPRAFIAREARIAPPGLQPLLEADLRRVVFIEEQPDNSDALKPASPELAEVSVSAYAANGLFVDLNLSDRGWLVVTDAYFPGWKAYIRPFGAGEEQEVEAQILRANGVFRSVYVPAAGQWTVRFVYSPLSFKLGLYTSFLAVMAATLLLLWWAWGRYYRAEGAGEVQTIAKNSLVPMTLSLFNKLIDFAFAMLYIRLLGPEGTGKYYFVVAIYGFFEILSRYGLGTLLVRDVAADKRAASRYLTNVVGLRTLLWMGVLPLITLVVIGYRLLDSTGIAAQSIGMQEIQALALLTVAMLFAGWADALSSLFNAFEKMEYTAAFANAAALFKVALGALVLLLGWGFVGLAGVSLLVNFLQLFVLYSMVRRVLFTPKWIWDWSLQRWMLANSGPLMINHLLATIFWRIDIWILRPLVGAASVGLYSVGIKYLDGINIIPSVFTMAVFPLMSRLARRAQGAAADVDDAGGNGEHHLLRSYILSTRLLLMLSLPIALSVTALAEPLVILIGGSQFLGQTETIHFFGRDFTYGSGSDLALQVVIWSIPIGFVNSVTQYVLIAVNQQRYLTKAFVIGVVFNVVGNLLMIPIFGYMGAAVVTILSELSLLFPFYYSVKRNVGSVPWFSICTPPLLSLFLAGMTILTLTGRGQSGGIALVCGLLVYAGALVATGSFRGDDMNLVARALPLGPVRRLLSSET